MKKVAFLLFSLVLLASCGNETAQAVEETSVDTTVCTTDSTACCDSTVAPEVEESPVK